MVLNERSFGYLFWFVVIYTTANSEKWLVSEEF